MQSNLHKVCRYLGRSLWKIVKKIAKTCTGQCHCTGIVYIHDVRSVDVTIYPNNQQPDFRVEFYRINTHLPLKKCTISCPHREESEFHSVSPTAGDFPLKKHCHSSSDESESEFYSRAGDFPLKKYPASYPHLHSPSEESESESESELHSRAADSPLIHLHPYSSESESEFHSRACDFPLKMTAVSAYKPKHGEDASFISPEFQTFGVADGVGGWRRQGIDGGEYARQLMANSILALNDETPGDVFPLTVLRRAFDATDVDGSSTACIVSLCCETLAAAYVGDSGFMVIRDDNVLVRSDRHERGFNSPFQLGRTRDDQSVAQLMGVAVKRGDVVVAGTDGFLDNLHECEILKFGANSKIRDENSLRRQANYMAEAAFINSRDRSKDTPYTFEASKVGKIRGGKPDDITLIIALIHD